MTEAPRISVVTPTFNSESTILRTVQSVISQGFDEIEYIVIDACSTDSTIEKISQYKDRVDLHSERDNGIFDGMNKGVQLCRGEIIGIINSDDWYLSGSLQVVWDSFQNSNCDVLIGSVDVYQGDHVIGSRSHSVKELDAHMVSHPGVFIKRRVYEEIGGYSLAYRVAADYDFLLRALKNGYKFSVTQKSLSAYSLGGYSDKPKVRIVFTFETEIIRHRHGIITRKEAFWNALAVSVKTILRRNHKYVMMQELFLQVVLFFKMKDTWE